jgi:pimeloyl-ACP methyl ester carboxylesterase
MLILRRRFLQVAAASSGAALVGRPGPTAGQQFVTSAALGDFKLFYEVHGQGPAVVFAHGSGGTHMSSVAAGSGAVAPVPMHHDRSSGVRLLQGRANGPGRRAFVQDLEGLLDRLTIDRVSLVGQSMGGSTVLGFAARHPERVSALILSDTTGGYTNPEIDRLRKTLPSTRSAFAPDYAQREPAMASSIARSTR